MLAPPTDPLDAQRSAFVEKIGLIVQGDGLPRAAGRIFGLLIWEGDAISFGDLASRLDLSRGSVSSGVRLLEDRGLIRRTARPGDRQDWFEMGPDPFPSILDGAAARVARAGADIAASLDTLPDDAPAAPRIRAYADFYATLETCLRDAARQLRTGT